MPPNSIGVTCVFGNFIILLRILKDSGKKFGPEGVEDYGLFSRVNDVIGVLLEFK